VTIATGETTANIYKITATANGNKMVYSNGTKSAVAYDDNQNVISNQIVSNGHQGTFDASDAGYTWIDSIDGTMVFVPWVGYR
jgi:hypothetical protein